MKPPSCNGCALETLGHGWVPSVGTARNRILLVGEAPGAEESKLGQPFVGASGKLLDRLLRMARLEREDFGVHNVLSCRPPANALRGASYEVAAISHCRPNLDATIERMNPKVIVALGAIPLMRLAGVDKITRFRGYALTGAEGRWIVPTFHPSYLLPRKGEQSTSHLTPAVVRDLKFAADIAQNGFTRLPIAYLEDPDPLRAAAFADEYARELAGNPNLPLAYDIETPYRLKATNEEAFEEIDTTIVQVSFCFRPGYAMSVPWQAPWMSTIKRLLLSSGPKWSWNGYHFDEPIIGGALGERLGGLHRDAMWHWHMLQPDLPRGLEHVTSYFAPDVHPWKHESTARPAYYSCVDADATLRNALGIESALKANGQWDVAERHITHLDPILRMAGENGVLIDRRARRALYKTLRQREKAILARIQPKVPDAVKPRKRYRVYPKRWEGRQPIEPVAVRGIVSVCLVCGQTEVTKGAHTARKGGRNGIPLNPCYKAAIDAVEGSTTEWDVVMEFNPNSTKQLMDYMTFHGHPLGRNIQSGNAAVDDLHLEKTIAKFGSGFIYDDVRDLREVRKTLSTYVEGFKPTQEGLLLTQYGYAPATGRLSSRGLKRGSDRGTNMQNCFAGDTEVLTPTGWQRFDALDLNAQVMEWRADGTLGFVKPTQHIKQSYNGPLISLQSRAVDLCVTPDHRIVWRSQKGRLRVDLAQDWLPYHGKSTTGKFIRGGWKIDGDEPPSWRELKQAIAVQAEGHQHGRQVIIKCRSARKRQQMRKLFDNVREFPTYSVVAVRLDAPCLSWLEFPSKTFRIDRLLTLHSGALRTFVAEVMRWDGDFTRGIEYLQRDDRQRAVDAVQLAAVLSGHSTYYSPRRYADKPNAQYTVVGVHPQPERHVSTISVTEVESADFVYCVTVPSGMLLTRRNGKVVVAGNCPHRGDHTYAEAIRRMIVPPEGHVFVEADSSSIEAVFTGFFMQDPSYTDIAIKGVHDYILCMEKGVAFTPENIARCKGEWNEERDRIKRTNHMLNYGGKARMLQRQYPKTFPTVKSATETIRKIYRILPKLAQFHHDVRVQAHKQTYLVNPGGYRRYFYDVFTYKRDKTGAVMVDEQGKPIIRLGEDGNAVIAQLPQSTAAWFQRENALRIGQEPDVRSGRFRLPGNFLIHDSYCLIVRDDEQEIAAAADLLERHLCRPIPELDGVRVGADIKVGRNWADMTVLRRVAV